MVFWSKKHTLDIDMSKSYGELVKELQARKLPWDKYYEELNVIRDAVKKSLSYEEFLRQAFEGEVVGTLTISDAVHSLEQVIRSLQKEVAELKTQLEQK